MLRSKDQRILVTRAQELGLLSIMTAIDWPNCVNNISRREVPCCRDHGLAGGQPLRILCSSDFLTGVENRWTTGAMNRAIDATATQKSRVGCVYNCINVQTCEVSNDDSHAPVEKRCFSFLHWILSQVGILFEVTLPLRHEA